MRCSDCNKTAYRVAPGVPALRDAGEVVKALPEYLATAEQEEFWLLLLNARHKMIGRVMIAKGSAMRCEVHVRDVFREAVRANAVAIIVAHNHPSGDPTPSADDIVLTRRIAAGARLVGTTLLDHVIVASEGHRSLAEHCTTTEAL